MYTSMTLIYNDQKRARSRKMTVKTVNKKKKLRKATQNLNVCKETHSQPRLFRGFIQATKVHGEPLDY